ncbi:MAG: sulfate adenylyltransferase subunit CysN [Kiritimatiellia bacterium]
MSNPALEAFLRENENKELLRFSTAGSIDDGKSTLIGRLLHDSKSVYEDVIASVKKASTERHFATGALDFSLLTDGLKAEREQGITIDVAYRYFSTPKRKFIIADTPGHEQYTRNMATGASTANLSIVLIDARNGILPQTKRHAFIASLLGVPHLVVAVNKMDAVGYDRAVYEKIRSEFEDFARKLSTVDVRFIPISALQGDNVVHRSPQNMPWYEGESLLELLENVYIGSDQNLIDLRFPVQLVIRPNMDFRGYAGQMVSGILRKGDSVMALPSRTVSKVKSIVTYDGERDEVFPPMSVTVTLEDERDISRGDMLVHVHNLPRVERHFEAMVVWMNDTPLDPERAYWVKHTTQTIRARVDRVRYKMDVNTLNRVDADRLTLNEIGRLVFTAHKPVFYDPYTKNRNTGSFILIDPVTNATVAAGMILDREPEDQLPSKITGGESVSELHPGHSRIAPAERAKRLGQQPATLWLTGLTGSGKSTIASALERRLFDLGASTVVLDGGAMRLGLSRELDFTGAGRAENLRRAAETARLLNETGLIVIAAFAAPGRDLREQVREIVGEARFLEIYLDAPLAVCEARTPDGLYRKAHDGRIATLPGVNVPYEKPEAPALTLPTAELPVEESVARILALLAARDLFPLRERA